MSIFGCYPLRRSRTFYEYIEDNNYEELYTGVSFTSEFDKESVMDIVEDWFYFRRICDEDAKFKRFFNRKMKLSIDQYNSLHRADTIDIDPMVSQYIERLVELESATDRKSIGFNKTDNENTGSVTSERTPDLTTDITNTDESTSKDTGTIRDLGESNTNSTGNTSGETSSTDTSNTHNKDLNGKLPMSAAYGNGLPSSLDWKNASEQNESEGESNSESTSTNRSDTETDTRIDSENTRTLNTTKTDESSGNTKQHQTGNEITVTTNTGSGLVNNNSSDETAINIKNETKEIQTGRSGILPQEALEKYKDYIRRQTAVKWLLEELEVLFLPLLD